MRVHSVSARSALAAQETGEAFLVLLKVTHPELPEPLRVTSDNVETVHGGEAHKPYPFGYRFPEDGDVPRRTELVIDNVARELVPTLRSIQTPPTVEAKVVCASRPDEVLATCVQSLRNHRANQLTISGELGYEDLLDEDFPADEFLPSSHPGLF